MVSLIAADGRMLGDSGLFDIKMYNYKSLRFSLQIKPLYFFSFVVLARGKKFFSFGKSAFEYFQE